ncbi:MAG: uroporphyrinogen-III synthase [Lewinellaceae bacterium]|nr:uroporphyrinogen-III synthase [Saprospiraceae bacterium]MCB9338190.1 uroporphyrinogen-III synthase [Lewinellaceae bacterium]
MEVLNGKVPVETYKTVKTILVTQPKPERSPYYDLEKKYNLQIDWRPFIHVEPISAKEFRRQRVRPDEYSSVILTSKNSVDHFFSLCEELRCKMSPDTKYFCLTEAVANYLQKFIIYRKRKVFAGFRTIMDLKPYLMKHKEKENFLFPCSNLGAKDIGVFLNENGFNWQEAIMYQTVSSNLSDLKDIYYDVIVFFSPLDILALYENFPDFEQKDTRIAVFGKHTKQAVEERGLFINIKAPEPETPSMTMALEKYLQTSNKD